MTSVRGCPCPGTMPHNTLSSIEDWFTHQSQTLDWKQRELDYAYADHYDLEDGQAQSVSCLSWSPFSHISQSVTKCLLG